MNNLFTFEALRICLTHFIFSSIFLGVSWDNLAQTPEYTPEIRRSYVAFKVDQKPEIDGKLDEESWENAPWSEPFVDIQGGTFPAPTYLTRMKMLWDEDHFYIGVKMEEPHLWATYEEPESVIFHENDIEVFLDMDGDTHNYYEWEINALGTLWDLMLTKPYRNGGKPINGWNINGFEYEVYLSGTLNDPSDEDEYWSVEMAIPWKALSQSGPSYRPPHDGEQWRINFSRVQWQLETESGIYKKVINPDTGKPFPEDNWVWSPIGEINMHIPERWGFVEFSEKAVGESSLEARHLPDEKVKDELRTIYSAQKKYWAVHKKYANEASELGLTPTLQEMFFEVSETRFKVSAASKTEEDKRWYITEDSRIWME
ncbi:carbohydrate-binding family 9-like protein [Pleomorphovibrio marinus]|uniref:carbohydrate-binding family 9-like protein n=1 Tax=Pleomorphovibrio marinus TaxID=2164132 RepID=UPI000E0B8E97|nr:carbohydrate-binding family 9-like protein [Pleomorphovibrio marinus]